MAKRIKSKLKKTGLALLSFFGLTNLMSCFFPWNIFPVVCMYGMPENYRQVYGTIKGDLDGDESTLETVEGISVSIEGLSGEEYECISSEDGSYGINIFIADEMVEDKGGKLTFNVKDIDGEANGSFEDQSFEVDFSENDFVNKDIVLVKKSSENK